MIAINNSSIVTLSSLLAKDVPQAYILPERPSTFNHKASFVNDKKYIIHDFSSNITADHRYLKAMRACPVAGNELPILLTRPVNPLIREVRKALDYKEVVLGQKKALLYVNQRAMRYGQGYEEHWSEWLPFLPKPDIRIFDKEDTKTRPMIVNFPFQSFPAEKHAVNPDIHYELSSKTKIPEMGTPCPRYMSRDSYTLPCMIKTTQGVGGRGVFLARNKDQAQKAFRELKTNFHCQEPVITEVIQHIKEFLNVQLYLFQNGDFHWLGVRRKTDTAFREVHQAPTPDVDWNEQKQLRMVAWDVASPVMSYLHKHRFFGFVGVEILINNKGKYLIDVNLKTSDSTYLLLLAPHLAAFLNFPVSIVADIHPTSIEQFLEEIHKINCEKDGRVIVLSGDEQRGGKPLKACVVVFAKNVKTAFLLHRELTNSCALISHSIGDLNNKNPNGRVLPNKT